jgi:hypothetical protein
MLYNVKFKDCELGLTLQQAIKLCIIIVGQVLPYPPIAGMSQVLPYHLIEGMSQVLPYPMTHTL